MAGAGTIVEKLPVVTVPDFLSEPGGKFLKWDDNDAACNTYIVKVDPKGHVLYWKPAEPGSKDPEVLLLTSIRDVRYGQYARAPRAQAAQEIIKQYCSNDSETHAIKERTFTVVHGPNLVDLTFINFVAATVAEAEKWGEALFKCTNNLLKIASAPLEFLECFYTQIYVQQNQDGEIPAKLLVKHFANHKDDKKRAHDTLQLVNLANGGKKDTIKAVDFTFERFLAFYNRLVTRTDMDTVFVDLGAKKKPYLTTDQMLSMLNNRQRDPRLNEILYPYYTKEQTHAFIQEHETTNKTFADQGNISVEGLTNYLMSPDNHVLFENKLNIHQEMTYPMSHYFINSSHNTYLTGHQLHGKSSVEIYRQILLTGCRCIELDCWDGRTEEQEPVITHGLTLCTEILFKDVIEAIKETAFKTSDYPLVLSFENHCSASQQKKMAMYCVKIFGDMLLDKELDEYPLEPGSPLPSPKALKRKILIKNKKRHPKEVKRSPSGVDSLPSASLSQDSPLGDVAEVPEEAEAVVEPDEAEEDKEPIVKTEEAAAAPAPEDAAAAPAPEEAAPAPTSEEEGSKTKDEGEDIKPKPEGPGAKEDEAAEVEAQQELSNLVNYFQPVQFRGFEAAEKVRKCYEMSSFTETSAFNYLKEQPIDFVNYNKFQPSRIYPKGSRINSDNYMPQLFWNAGCQFVALNFQTLDLPMMLNMGKFEMNGRSGYLLKPEHMRRTDQTFDPFVESIVSGIIAGTVQIRILSAQCLSDKRVSTYVEVEMYGLPADTVRRKYKTKTVPNNGLNPIYEEEPFSFKVILPQLAEMRIAVYEDNGRLIGHRILPVDGLSPGYRHIKLRNESYQPLLLQTVFVDIVTKDYVPDKFAEFAEALQNPKKYISEQEKREDQMKLLLGDEGGEDQPVEPKDASTSPVDTSAPVVTPPTAKPTAKPTKLPEKSSDGASVVSPPPAGKPPPSNDVDENGPQRANSQPSGNANFSRPATGADVLADPAPDLETLMDHKDYKKLLSKHNNAMKSLVSKHTKDRAASIRPAKGVEVPAEEQKGMLKTKFNDYYQEQLNLAKTQVEAQVRELTKVLEQIKTKEQKKLQEHHAKTVADLNKEQAKQNRETIKRITKETKDKAELQRLKRERNKSHIDQVVRLRQNMKDLHEKEEEQLAKRYDVRVVLEGKAKKDMEELDEIFKEKTASLETEDLTKAQPMLLSKDSSQVITERANSVP